MPRVSPHTAGTAVKSGRYRLTSHQTVFLPPDRRWLGSNLGKPRVRGGGVGSGTSTIVGDSSTFWAPSLEFRYSAGQGGGLSERHPYIVPAVVVRQHDMTLT